ncbi:hypothetical protein TKK_0000031 [Trichogramma kaykai]|uniref:Uncharacterized protein n=1 Tax=Trichogramma kaykai TaxID=54128 RepID=A0ABD2VTX2_9HYME
MPRRMHTTTTTIAYHNYLHLSEQQVMSTTNDNDTASRVTPIKAPPQGHNHAQAKYSKLQTAEPGEDDTSSPHRMCLQDAMCNPNYRLPGMTLAAPKKLTHSQSDNTGILKTVSRQIGSQDLDERQVMLDDLGNEMEIITDSKYDTTMSKMARVFQLSNGNYKNKYAPAPTQANMTPPHHRRNFGSKQQQLDNDYNRQIPNPCSIASTITNCFYICNRN